MRRSQRQAALLSFYDQIKQTTRADRHKSNTYKLTTTASTLALHIQYKPRGGAEKLNHTFRAERRGFVFFPTGSRVLNACWITGTSCLGNQISPSTSKFGLFVFKRSKMKIIRIQ